MRPQETEAGDAKSPSELASPIRVLVVDLVWWWREALLRVLERSPKFAPFSATDCDDARSLLASADVAIVDLDHPGGLEIVAAARDADVPCVGLSNEAKRELVSSALAAGASYAVKSELDPERVRHLVAVAADGDALLVRASSRFLRNFAALSSVERYGLTPRELDVLAEIAVGRTNSEIAATLHLAPSSVKKLVSRCLTRLGVRNRVEAALVARREGLVASGEAEIDAARER